MIYKLKSNQIDNINKAIKEKKKVTVRNLQDAERAFLLSGFNDKILYVATSLIKARMIEKQFSSLGKRTLILSQTLDVISYKANSNEILESYCYALSQIALDKIDVIIILPDLLLQKLPQKDTYNKEVIKLKVGGKYNLSDLKLGLLGLGYKRVERVENPSQFAIRGDILDVFPVGYDNAIRVDFWGDDVETIKMIDLSSYASFDNLTDVSICPFTFNLGKVEEKDLSFLNNEPEIKEKVLNGIKDNSLIFALPAYKDFSSSFVEWFKDDIVAIDEPKRVYDLANEASLQLINDNLRRIEENILTKKHLNFYKGVNDILLKSTQSVMGFVNLDVKNPLYFADDVANMTSVVLSNYVNNEQLLKNDLQYFCNQRFTTLLCYETPEQCEILRQTLKNMGLTYNEIDYSEQVDKKEHSNKDESENLSINDTFSGRNDVICDEDMQSKIKIDCINIVKSDIAYSVGFMAEKFVAISKESLFREVTKQINHTQKSRVFYLPKIGDYVVHSVQGIGKCIDIKKMNLGFCEKDYIVIEYAKGDILYLPTEHTDEISQYLGSEEAPKLNILGGEQFKKIKEKARASLKELAFDLKKLYAKRKALKGYVYSADNYLVDEFQKSCGFELTRDQIDAINDIKADMESGKVMDRLICGDVGFGKTEVALVAAFKTVLEGKQVAFLAPTTILCHQHYVSVQNRMKDFMVKVGMLSRFNTAKENDEIVKKVASGEINIVCGTHRMLSDDVKFKDLGLLILDEEQRFGVADKEKIKTLKANINVLTLSATPIPRTLHMSLIGIRDTSLITTPPKTRLPITSIVCEYSPQILVEACRRELSRDGQVLIVFNRVDGIYQFAEEVQELLPDASIEVAHGQMDKNTLESVVLKLYAKEVQILIATTLIENGIDLPMANTLIVINADAMGLSQLYQLRGRVGRSNRSSFAYFTYDKDRIVSDMAMRRLEALKEFSDLGSGFKIAMRDLEIRGAGTLLGAKQSGHIEKIGYDLYCKLLEEAILESEGKKDQILRDVKIEIAIPAYAPDNYISSGAERMKLYNDIAMLTNESDAYEKVANLQDAYGKPPKEVEQLIKVGLIKNMSKACGIKKIVINDFASFIEFYEDDEKKIEKAKNVVAESFPEIRCEIGKDCKFLLDKTLSIAERQNTLIKFLLKLSKLVA